MPRLPALPFVRASITQGISAERSYRQFVQTAHENDLTGIRRQDYLRLYSQTRAIRERSSTGMDLPKEQVPSSDHIVNRDTENARGYGQWVGIHQRTRGQSDYLFTPFLVKSNVPLTPGEAEARALDYLEQQPDEYNRVTLGVGFMVTERFNPRPR